MNSSASPSRSSSSLSRLRICACTETSSAETASSQMSSCGAGASALRDGDPLLLTAGEPSRLAPGVRGRQPDHVEQLGNIAPADRPPARSASDSAAPIVMAGFSAEVGSWKTIWARRAWRQVARPVDRSAVVRLQPDQAPCQGRLSRSGLADDPDRLTRADGDGDVIEGWGSGLGEALADTAQPNQRLGDDSTSARTAGTDRGASRRHPVGASRRPASRHLPAGLVGPALLVGARAARGEGASDKDLPRTRNRAGHRPQLLDPVLERWLAVAQYRGVRGAAGRRTESAPCPRLHQPPGVHDQDPVCTLARHAEVMGDEQQRHAPLALDAVQQVEHLALGGHVERRGRLVADQHLGVAREAGGQCHPLTHATGELERVLLRHPRPAGPPRRVGGRSPHARDGMARAAAICEPHLCTGLRLVNGFCSSRLMRRPRSPFIADGPSARSTTVSPSRTAAGRRHASWEQIR